ncbi:uncharacterized protein LOC134230786 [Saccostrea cucullata]|uniref:uncharacterized protein LOC134230786 n=1 Tax=Saccostrea cuccullata TaxID=36930 RepID=UPI002ED35218
MESLGYLTDFETISASDLNTLLGRFYAEACKQSDKRKPSQNMEYHKNSFKSIRSALNRYLQDLGRDFDIVRGREFRTSNNILDGKLKKNLQDGLSKPTQHKEIIPQADLLKISAYLFDTENPITLRFRTWFIISMQFVTRGLEFHHQLKRDSFVFKTDENGDEYVTLSHETKQKNWQGGIDSTENPKEKRMYAVPSAGDKCPLKTLKLFISKTDPNAEFLFNRCIKAALSSPENLEIWYDNIPLKPYQFTRFMADISKHSDCSRRYTAHCLRATAIQGMNDAGYEIRHIMHMSGHKSEASVRSYNRDCTTIQKKNMSDTLSRLTVSTCSPGCIPKSQTEDQSQSIDRMSSNVPISASSSNPGIVSLQSSNILSAGFMANSTFNNCVFNFEK